MKSLPISFFSCTRRFWGPLLLLILFLEGAGAAAQTGSVLDKKITLDLSGVTVREALDEISRVAGCTFSYTSTLLDVNRRVSIRKSGIPVQEALKELLGSTLYKLQARGTQIHIQTVEGGGKGDLKGAVRTSDGEPASFVSVSVKGTGKGAVTDEQGNYQVKNLQKGEYTVTAQLIGYAQVERRVEVRDGAVTEVPLIQLDVDSKALQEVLIRGNVNRFAVKESDYVAKMPLSDLENPQVYTTVTSRLMKEQLVVTYSDALKNVPGVVMMLENNSAGGSVTSRGFSTQTFLRNGVPGNVGSGSIDPANIEKVEAVKGPSGSLFGSSFVSYGGLFNRVTKRPEEEPATELTFVRGGYGLSRVSADVNTPLNEGKTVLLRVNAALHKEGSFQDAGFKSYVFVSPVLVYRLSGKTRATVEAEYRKEKANSFYRLFVDGSYATGVRRPEDLNFDFKRRFYGDDIYSNTGIANLYVTLDHEFSRQWRSRTNITYLSSTGSGMSGFMSMRPGNDSLSRSLSNTVYSDVSATNIQQNFLGDFNLGNMRNRLLIGLDFYGTTTKSGASPTITYDVVSAAKPGAAYTALNSVAAQSRLSGLGISRGSSQQNIYSAYLQDVLNIFPRLAVLASLRVDIFDNKGTRNITLGTTVNQYSQTALSPKLGFTYQVIEDQFSFFGNYMNGFQNIAPVTQPDGSISTFKPSQANQWEFGVKFDMFKNGLSGSISYYDIGVRDVTRADYPDRPAFTVQDGDQYSKGFETQLIAKVFSGFSLIGGYAYNSSKYEKINLALDGFRPTSAGPAHTANLWGSYGISKGALHGLGIGAGVNYSGENKVILTSTSEFTLPAYAIWGSTIFYNRQRYGLSCKIDNLTNETYWVGWGTTIPQMPRRVSASFTVRF